MEFRKIEGKTMFKPSFGGKKGTTDFYQAFIDGDRAGEIEVKPIGYNGKPEILSIYSDYRNYGVGKFLTQEVLKLYLEDEVYVKATVESKPFWLKMGAEVYDGLVLVFRKKIMEHIKSYSNFK